MKKSEKPQMITDVDAALIKEAGAFAPKKKKWKVFLPVAASVLLIAGAFSGMFYYNSNKVRLDSNGKIDIYSMKGAQILDADKMSVTGWAANEEPTNDPEEFGAHLKKDIILEARNAVMCGTEVITALVYGTAKNIKAVTMEEVVDNNKLVWNIVTFDIDIIDDLQTLGGRETVHVVSASLCENGYLVMELNARMNEMLSNPVGVFMLNGTNRESLFEIKNTWKIKGKEYKVSDFADYFVYRRYDCDGESFQYYGVPVRLEDLRIEDEK